MSSHLRCRLGGVPAFLSLKTSTVEVYSWLVSVLLLRCRYEGFLSCSYIRSAPDVYFVMEFYCLFGLQMKKSMLNFKSTQLLGPAFVFSKKYNKI